MLAPKMLDPSRLFRVAKYAAGVLLLLFLAVPYLRDHSPRVRGHYDEILRSFQDEKKLFVADFLAEGEVGGNLPGAALARLCAARPWYPEDKAVIVSCEPIAGGLGEVRNGQLNCIRFAIEIGAQLVLPRMHTRSTSDITNLHGGQHTKGVGLDYMFSQSHLVDSLQAHCPQLRVHASLDALYDKPSLLKPLPVSLPQLTAGEQPATLEGVPTTVLGEPARLRDQFVRFLDAQLPPPTRRYPVRVHLAETVFAWPTAADGEAFRADFGALLRVRDDVRALAASALWNLARKHGGGGGGDSAAAGGGDVRGDEEEGGAGFLAVHLRTERDALRSGAFPAYDDQSAYFFSFLQSLPAPVASVAPAGGENRKRVVFLATGLAAADDDVRRFRARAAELNATVVLKRDLLDAAEAGVLNSLTWDQRALLDYEILLRAGTMLGTVESTFAWSVALRRGLAYGGAEGDGFTARPGGEGLVGQGTMEREALKMWADRYSRLYGRSERAVSIYLGSWP